MAVPAAVVFRTSPTSTTSIAAAAAVALRSIPRASRSPRSEEAPLEPVSSGCARDPPALGWSQPSSPSFSSTQVSTVEKPDARPSLWTTDST